MKEKTKEEYRIINLTKGHICPCVFKTYKDAVEDFRNYERDGKIEIISFPEGL